MAKQLPPISRALTEYIETYGMQKCVYRSGVSEENIRNIALARRRKYKMSVVNRLYDFLELPRDEWYVNNYRSYHTQHESILGEFFRAKRFAKRLTVSEVAKATKLTERTILRLEAGEWLPEIGSYTMVTLSEYYEFSEEEKQKVRWYIVILKDLIWILKQAQNPPAV